MLIVKKTTVIVSLICCLVAYVSCLSVIFRIAPESPMPTVLLYLLEESEMLSSVTVCLLLIAPDFVALCIFLNKRKQSPGHKYQLSTKCRVLQDLLLASLILVFFYRLVVDNAYDYWVQVPITALMAVSLIAFFFSQPFRFLKNSVSEQEALQYIESLISSPPYIKFTVHAYHYETRFRIVQDTRTDSRGNTQTTTRVEPYQQIVTTLDRHFFYEINYWRDVTDTKRLLAFQQSDIVKIKITPSIEALDNASQNHYNSFFSRLKDKYANVDTCVDWSVHRGINKMQSDVLLSHRDISRKPLFINALACFLFSLTPFGWTYSLWLDTIASVFEATICKEYSHFPKTIAL